MDDNEKDFLKFYMEQTWEEMRHIENLREKVTILVVTIASAVAGFVMQQKFAIETKPFAWFVIILGVFGLTMTLKLFQIHQMDQKRLDKWYLYLESFCGKNSQILKLRDLADKENIEHFYFISKLRHNYFWSAMHSFIIIAGIVLLSMYPSTKVEANEAHNCCKVKKHEKVLISKDTTNFNHK